MQTKPRILVVDDVAALRRLTIHALTAADLELIEADSGETCLRQAHALRPDLILLDVVLPGMDGIATCRRLKADPTTADIPILLLSGLSTDTLEQAAGLEAGADGYIARPVSGRELVARIEALLRVKRAEDALRATNAQLQAELDARRQAEAALQKTQEALELRVQERTSELAQANAALGAALDTALQRATECAALLNATRAVLGQSEFKDAARAIYDQCKNAIGATGGFVALLLGDGVTTQALFLDSGGAPCLANARAATAVHRLRGECLRAGRVVYYNDFAQSDWAGLTPPGHMALENVLCAPLAINSKVVGLLGLVNKPGGFTDEDVRMAAAFGEVAAIALQHSWMLESLQNSEAHFHAVAQSAADAIISANSGGEIVFWNTAAEAIFGYPAGDMLGKPLTSIMPESDYAAYVAGMRRALRTGDKGVIGKTVEGRGRRRNGELFPAEVSLSEWKTREGIFFTGIIRDIGERKAAATALQHAHDALEGWVTERTSALATANRALQQADTQLHAILDNAPAVIYAKDLQGRFLFINRRFAELFQLDCDQVVTLGQTDHDIFPAELAGAFRANDLKVMAADTALELEEVAPHEDGLHTYISLKFPLYDTRGQPYAVCGISTDITERARTEAALQASEAKARFLADILERTSQPFGVGYLDGRMGMVNAAFCDLVGYSAEELQAIRWNETLTPPEWGQLEAEQLAILICTKKPVVYEKEYLRKDGSRVPVESLAHLVCDESGAPQYYYGFITDITERKKTQAQLDQMIAELSRSNAELERFAYIASHDLQEPLRMVASFVQLLGERYRGQLDADADDFIGFVVEGAHRMQQLLLDLLEYSRADRVGRPFTATNSRQTLDMALHYLQLDIEDSHALITSDPLPIVLADQAQLAQLFENLIGNAIKFRGAAPPAVHVAVRLTSADLRLPIFETAPPGADRQSQIAKRKSAWEFSVRDNGVGIEPQYHERIFVAFQRLHSRALYAGNGIGLAICQKIVERHGGRIWVESQEGQGSTFYFTLPAVGGAEEPSAVA